MLQLHSQVAPQWNREVDSDGTRKILFCVAGLQNQVDALVEENGELQAHEHDRQLQAYAQHDDIAASQGQERRLGSAKLPFNSTTRHLLFLRLYGTSPYNSFCTAVQRLFIFDTFDTDILSISHIYLFIYLFNSSNIILIFIKYTCSHRHEAVGQTGMRSDSQPSDPHSEFLRCMHLLLIIIEVQ